ncbi:hypothetical protein [Luteithermobacter gelatinilyticus]|uniref:hypothetical protein n=1 Tax=Luteithermobacter gelatinilyticus TaxID=2582913 RepID=UPI00110686FF|nr:hypothetical protein [Luteithermobacter gelatinilyticus]
MMKRHKKPERARQGSMAVVLGLLVALFGMRALAGPQDQTPAMPEMPAMNEELLTDLDVPLYEGLREEPEERVVFDSAEGRIIQARARGGVPARKIYDFYKVVLPSLGWRISASGEDGGPADPLCEAGVRYCLKAERDRENLVIGIMPEAASETMGRTVSRVSFVLTPK